MKKILTYTLLIMLIAVNAYAYTRQYTWSTGDTMTAARLNGDFDNLASEGITTSNLADSAVTSAKIQDATIAGADLNSAIAISTTGGVTTNALTATSDLDIGAYELRAKTLESDVATGTAPLTIASTTVSTNLNADLLDGQEGSYYTDVGNVDAGTLAIANGGTGLATRVFNSVAYSGTTANNTVAHGLGTTPVYIVFTSLEDGTKEWYFWMTGMPSNKARSGSSGDADTVFTAAVDGTNVYLVGAAADINENGVDYRMAVFGDQ